MKRSLWIILLAVAIAAGGGAYWYASRPEPPRYVTQAVKRGDLIQVVSATGTLNPLVLSPVGSQVSGIVWKIHADYNDRVKKGQTLVELDPALFNAAVAQNEANLASARADVAKAEADLANARLQAGRARALAEKRYISQADRDTAIAAEASSTAAVAGARARVQQATAALSRSRLDLKNSVVLSPVDGVVIARNVELGQAVVASFQAPNLFTIAEDLRKMQVLANVDEADIGMLREGQPAQFTVDAYRGRRFAATVAQVRNAAQTVQNVVTYVVVLNVDNSDLLLKPGMTANVRLEVARRENVLTVANTALRFKPPVTDGKPRDAAGPRGGASDRPDGGVPAGAVAAGEGERSGDRSGERSRGRGRWRNGGGPDGGVPAGAVAAGEHGGGPGNGGPGGPGMGPGGGPGNGGAGMGPGGGPGGFGQRRGAGVGRGTVYVQGAQGLQPVPVVTGITDGERTEILRGLEEGQEVIVELVRPRGSGPAAPPPGMMPGMPGMQPPRGGGGGGGGGRRVGL